ncbi:glycosyltransferase family 2 protein [Persicimonas caeni]|uniref:Glycosyltransferase family 2 protein n=1 Tax=Persicimonas caeni TaxID=2292766 RepID=A0A4Y6Q1S2_PERCE|nr:glycosyltransferase family 2 protein [Persicimonas caeni]QED35737.1 glycosyltransferase family 2 protein [Persicimonas caeni]
MAFHSSKAHKSTAGRGWGRRGGVWWPKDHNPQVPESTTIDVLIPALNEEKSIGHVLDAIPDGWVRRVVVVDNGSTDQTAVVAREHGAEVVFEQQRGYGAACLAGLRHLAHDPPDIVTFMDADFSDHPNELPRVVEPILNDGVDLVIGSRTIGQNEPGALLPQAVFGNKLACFLVEVLYGYRFTDLGPFRAVRWSSLQLIGMEDEDFGWTVEMQVKAAKMHLSAVEVPVSYRKRVGVSKITGTLKGTVLAGHKILYTIFKEYLDP